MENEMEALRIENLRSLADTGFIDLKPVTLLLGQNSSGKSTFLRCFPLLRQSVEARTTGPILWYGRFVDFGSFSEAIRTSEQSQHIILHFRFTISPKTIDPRIFLRRNTLEPSDLPVDFSLMIAGDDDEGSSQVSEILIKFAIEHTINLHFDQDGRVNRFIVNQSDFSQIGSRFQGNFQRFGIVPTISERIADDVEQPPEIPLPTRRRAFYESLLTEVKKLVHKNTKNETLARLINSIRIGSSNHMLKSMKENKSAPETWRDNVTSWSVNNLDFCRIRDLVIANAVSELLMLLDGYIVNFAVNSRYVAPVRATAERYYRIQNLAVDELDFQGQNLAMFLRNLTYRELRSFQEWTQSNFGFTPEVSASSGHISLKLREVGSTELFNLADKGFGFSQILPILTQLWVLVYQSGRKSTSPQRRSVSTPVTFTIEQPELHLHPYLQAQLVDAFLVSIKAARNIGIDLRLIVETHSETMVNRLGHRIANGDFDPKEINVVLFEKKSPDSSTLIRHSKYDKNGFLKDWPFGFFEPSEV
jgi:predicted ATP-dependent endonuclease of OLD family